jgi:hypothetical protein
MNRKRLDVFIKLDKAVLSLVPTREAESIS